MKAPGFKAQVIWCVVTSLQLFVTTKQCKSVAVVASTLYILKAILSSFTDFQKQQNSLNCQKILLLTDASYKCYVSNKIMFLPVYESFLPTNTDKNDSTVEPEVFKSI